MRYALLLALAGGAWAQQLNLSVLDKLESRARDKVFVDLDQQKLKLVSQFLSGRDAKAQQAIGVLSGVTGISVRTFEFAGRGQYTQADLEPIRSQLKTPNWSRIIEIRGTESVEVWFHMDSGKMTGLALIAGEPEELTVVNIVGPIDLNSLAKLSGSFGIPDLQSDLLGGKSSTPKKDDDE